MHDHIESRSVATNKEPFIFELALNRNCDDLLYRQICQRFREAITNGSYPPGTRVPSIRTLAAQLNISRNTVEIAYDQLIGEGYFVANGQAGTSVSGTLIRSPRYLPPPTDKSAPARPLPFQIGIPALDAFPTKLWGSLNQKHWKNHLEIDLASTGTLGHEPLREAIAAYLNISRGINCSSSQIIITSGYRQSLHLLMTGLLKRGDSVWTEDPCYPPASLLLAQHGLHQCPLPVDAEGLIVAEGLMQAPDAKLALVTPANQNPLGMVLSMRRKTELLEWAHREQSWIIEDDYDSEYCFDGRMASTVSSLDRNGRTFYMGTFSKTMFPALRLAYVVVPLEQIKRFTVLSTQVMDGCTPHSQKALADMMVGGHFARHVKKMRTLYNVRRQAMVQELKSGLGDKLNLSHTSRGLCLLAHLNEGVSDALLAERAAQRGLAVGALSPRVTRYDYGQGLLLGFANFNTDKELKHAVQMLGACFI